VTLPPASRSFVGCVRVSTDRQADQYGPDRQRQEIEQDAAREGLTLLCWVEESVSGADHDRAAENAFYKLAREHPGLNFLFSHPNRVGRHIEVTVGIARTLHRLGATVWVAGLGNLRDARNWKYFLRDAADAEADYLNIVGQMVAGKRAKAAGGKWPHGAPPWGYVLARDARGRSTLPVPDPATAPAVRRVFELAEKLGQTQTMYTMRAEGWPAQTKSGWTVRSVANILVNERYTGRAVFAGIGLEFEGIVSPEQFARVQGIRAGRKRHSGPRDTSLLWSGHVRCEDCGAAIGRDTHRTPYGHYIYYRCWRANKAASRRELLEACPNTRSWGSEAAAGAWWDYLSSYVNDPLLLATATAPVATTPAAPPARIAELEREIENVYAPLIARARGYTLEMAEKLATPYADELDKLKAAWEAHAPGLAVAPDHAGVSARLGAALAGALSQEERRELLGLLDVCLYVGRDGPTRLTLTIP
jgi:DNA invertase Pin-like site-specific DNA recombinase